MQVPCLKPNDANLLTYNGLLQYHWTICSANALPRWRLATGAEPRFLAAMTQTLLIEAMSCSHCLNAVNRAIGTVPGVKILSVAIGRATVEYQESVVLDRVMAAVTDAGYRTAMVP